LYCLGLIAHTVDGGGEVVKLEGVVGDEREQADDEDEERGEPADRVRECHRTDTVPIQIVQRPRLYFTGDE